uniref:Putative secreted protein n=1 Tax=Panstrongylus lignarius TaxID=156445 RepID=A0A224Y5N6_9HEMI
MRATLLCLERYSTFLLLFKRGECNQTPRYPKLLKAHLAILRVLTTGSRAKIRSYPPKIRHSPYKSVHNLNGE